MTPPSGSPSFEPVTPDRIDANWRAISFELDAPRPSLVERLLRTVRVPADAARLVVATPALRRSWYIALAIVVFVALAVPNPDDPRASLFAFLFLAPLAPLAGVALAYGRWADPAHELHTTTPMHGLRLLLIRTTTVVAVSFVIIGGLSLTNEVARPMAAAWLLPALALTSATTAAMTVTTPTRAALSVTGIWTVLALVGRAAADDELGAFGPTAQATSLMVVLAGAVVTWVRRERFDVMVPG